MVHDGFLIWVDRRIGGRQPALVKRYFDQHGFRSIRSREGWRKLLNGHFTTISIETWCEICEVAQLPLSAFIEYMPTGGKPLSGPVPARPGAREVVRPITTPARVPPPDPLAYYAEERR